MDSLYWDTVKQIYGTHGIDLKKDRRKIILFIICYHLRI